MPHAISKIKKESAKKIYKKNHFLFLDVHVYLINSDVVLLVSHLIPCACVTAMTSYKFKCVDVC